MISGSVTRCTGLMTEKESLEAFIDGTKMCASAARELAVELDDLGWNDIATFFDCLRVNGHKLANMRSMSRSQVMEALNMKSSAAVNSNVNPLKLK